ncbi:branched-chain amino acid ABC transporter permease [Paracraurococcus lichenis]|uniref:Branched-chain amino acid ABC transporter permease n=1 Tax=Paracraurococcus lichenis TaxID=3064888 RepID=A0ABT9E6K1_9PROT|nr:branched-chain amino acid ABC transporter permease [Paracraurococcus sp. LOR1-02]MDO9711812.1 branched-chain amino acid ABC transporter permease [Paracraurococcus sp. LOR1-02]
MGGIGTEKGRAAFQAALALFAAAVAAWWLPQVLELFSLINATVYTAMAVLALSLGLVWGFGGILCFGQAAFFGLGGYAYAVGALNFPDTTWAIPVALLVPALAAAALGYVMFYGRISDVYMGVITLTVTLILFNFINSTAGDEWRIGAAPLGGFNGIPATPPLNLPGDPGTPLAPEQIFAVAVLCLGACYALCKLILRSHFGRVVVAIRENELRAALLGYDVRLYKLGIFTIGGTMAGLAGLLFANCVFVSPTMFSLAYSGQIIIWVMVGGVGTLFGPVVGAMLLQALTAWAGTLPEVNPNLILGLVLVVAVLAIPRGLQPTLLGLVRRREEP